jgi:hypothetical protein
MKITNDNMDFLAKEIKEALAVSKDDCYNITGYQRYRTKDGKEGEYPYCTECEEELQEGTKIKHLVEQHITEEEDIAIKHTLQWLKNKQEQIGK